MKRNEPQEKDQQRMGRIGPGMVVRFTGQNGEKASREPASENAREVEGGRTRRCKKPISVRYLDRLRSNLRGRGKTHVQKNRSTKRPDKPMTRFSQTKCMMKSRKERGGARRREERTEPANLHINGPHKRKPLPRGDLGSSRGFSRAESSTSGAVRKKKADLIESMNKEVNQKGCR